MSYNEKQTRSVLIRGKVTKNTISHPAIIKSIAQHARLDLAHYSGIIRAASASIQLKTAFFGS